MRATAVFVLTMMSAGVAAGQTTAPLTPPGAGGSTQATPKPVPDTGIGSSPTPGLVNPGNPDPGMAIKPPAVGITPILPPSGPGSTNPTIIPK